MAMNPRSISSISSSISSSSNADDDNNNNSNHNELEFLRRENAQLKQRNAELENQHGATMNRKPKLLHDILEINVLPFMNDGWGVEIDGVNSEFVIPVLSSANECLIFERHSLPFSKEFIASLVRDGKLSILKQVYEVDNGVLDNGVLDRNFAKPNYDTSCVSFTAYATIFGQLEILKWLLHLKNFNPEFCFSAASRCGHIHILEWLREQQYFANVIDIMAIIAAHHGQLKVLQWFLLQGYPLSTSVCAQAASRGDLAMLQWLQANGCPWDEWACAGAAGCGDWNMLLWLRANECPWNEWACAKAVGRGDLNMLQWLRANGCPWNERACAKVVACGDLNMLQWLRANGCPWSERACVQAARRRDFALLQWLRANRGAWN